MRKKLLIFLTVSCLLLSTVSGVAFARQGQPAAGVFHLCNASPLRELQVGDNFFTIGPKTEGAIYLEEYFPDQRQDTDFLYTVQVDNLAVTDLDSGQEFTRMAGGTFNVPARALGHKLIEITAYRRKEGTQAAPVYSYSLPARVQGWALKFNVNEFIAHEAVDLTLAISDGQGPINNARIVIEDYLTLSAGSLNVQEGVYSFPQVKFSRVGPQAVKAYWGERLMAHGEIMVKPQLAYQIASRTSVLLQGQAEDVLLNIDYLEGITEAPRRLKWLYADGSQGSSLLTYTDKYRAQAPLKAMQKGPLTLWVENADGTLYGQTTVEVVAPQLEVLSGGPNLTNNIKTKLSLQVIDPRTQQPLWGELEVLPRQFSRFELFGPSGLALEGPVSGNPQYSLTFLAQVTPGQMARQAALGFSLDGIAVEGALPVAEASLTSTPEAILVGDPVALTFTYIDANGKPLANRALHAADGLIGYTNARGQAEYYAGVIPMALEARAATDNPDAFVSLPVALTFDEEAPQVHYTVKNNIASFKITDNIRISSLCIDGQVPDFWPAKEYEFSKSLKAGQNSFSIQAQDSAGNVLNKVINITYTPPQVKPVAVTLSGSQVLRQGDFIYVQARALESLGARFTWQARAQIATFVLSNRRVEVGIGSLIGKVNGRPQALPAAPLLVGERTFIPLRFIGENLGFSVRWSPGDIITISL